MNQFTIHPSLRFVSIGKILTSDSIKLDGESLAREKEYTKALQTFGKNNSIKPKNWDAELKMKDYFEMHLDQYKEDKKIIKRITLKIRLMFYGQALLGALAIFFLTISQIILGIMSGIIALIWFIYLFKNKSKIVNKNIEHEKKFVQKKFERETKERQEKKESFIKTEEERIATIKKMLAHDEKATICCLIESLSGLELPFTFEGSLVIEKDSALLLYVTLPAKKIIPLYLREKKKKKREKLVDEHYLEVLSRLFVLLINILYNTIPWLDLVKIKGSDSKESEKKEQMLIALTRNDFRVIDFSLDNPFIQLHNVPTVKCELNIDKRININALMKKEDKSGIIPEIEIGE